MRALRLHTAHVDTLTERSSAAVGLALAARIRSLFFSGLNAAELAGLAAVLTMGFVLVRDDVITIGAATAAALYFHRLFDPVGTLLFQLDTAQSAGAALARLIGVASLAPRPDPPADADAGAGDAVG